MISRNRCALAVVLFVVTSLDGAGALAATWNGGSGNWNTPSNWTPADVPDVAGETADISAAGTYTVTLNTAPIIDSLTINAAGALLFANNQTLTTNGPFNILDGSAEFRASDINGAGTLTNNGTLTLISTAADHTFVNSGFVNNGTFVIRGLNVGNHTTVEMANGFTNNGLMRLGADVGWQANLIVNGTETITNSAMGIIRSQTISSTGLHTISANITNSGLIEVIDPISFIKSGGTINNNAAGSSFTVNSGSTATFTSGVFNQSAGSTTIASGGTITGLTSYTLGGGTLDASGALTIGATGTFTQNSGNLLGTGTISVGTGGSVSLNGGAMTGTPTFILGSGTGAVATLAIGAGYVYNANTTANGSTTITGNFTVNAGRTFTITGGGAAPQPKTITVPAFTNNGTINMGGAGNGWHAELSILSGTLTNAAGGVINMINGAGSDGADVTLAVELNNQGTLNVNTTTTDPFLGRTGAAHINSGTIDVNDTITISGSSFTQTGGIFRLSGGNTAFSTTSLSFVGGTIEGGAGTLVANVNATGVGSGLTLSPGQSTGVLDINGSVTLDANDTVLIEIGGTTQGALVAGYDWLDISGATALGDATLSVSLVDGFEPIPSQTFTILTSAGGLSGQFGNTPLGTIEASGYLFDVTISGNSVVLSNGTFIVPIPEPSSGLLLGLGALLLRRKRGARKCSLTAAG